MQITIITFGQIAALLSGKITLENVVDTDTLKERLAEEYPALLNMKYAIAVDKKIVSGNVAIRETSTVALLPPFSGG